MGYVPSRQYTGLTGQVAGDKLRLQVATSQEDAWFFCEWLRGEESVRVWNRETGDGVDIEVDFSIVRQRRRVDQVANFEEISLEGFAITVTAQGVAMLAVLKSADAAAWLAYLAGFSVEEQGRSDSFTLLIA